MLVCNMMSRTSEMSDVNLIHYKHITNSSERKRPYFCQTFCCLVFCVSTGYAAPLPFLHKEKKTKHDG